MSVVEMMMFMIFLMRKIMFPVHPLPLHGHNRRQGWVHCCCGEEKKHHYHHLNHLAIFVTAIIIIIINTLSKVIDQQLHANHQVVMASILSFCGAVSANFVTYMEL